MFTGLIEEVAQVENIRKKGNVYFLCIKTAVVHNEAKEGDSIAVNGVCLTVVANEKNTLSFDVMGRTFKNTNLSFLKKKDFVNVESALTLQDKLGGHFVQGHIDCMANIKGIKKRRDGLIFELSVKKEFSSFIVPKGSVALDGISLTVQETKKDTFSVCIIPHTFEKTNLRYRKAGDKLNLELDILAKYAGLPNNSSGLTKTFLKEKGF